MFNFSSYILYNLSNLLFALLIPNSFAKLFFINYSLASGIFTFVIFYNFSKKNIFSEKFVMFLNLILIFFSEIFNLNILIIWIFTFLLIYSDYFFSQRKNYILNFSFKLMLLISSLLLYQNFLDPIYVLKIKVIVIYFTFLFYNFFCKKNSFTYLNVSSPLIYNISTILIYFCSLFILTIFISDLYIKIVFVSFQVLIGIHLKLFDLKIRSINTLKLNIEFLFTLFSFLYLAVLCFYTDIYFLMIIYFVVFLSLNFLKKKYIH